MTVPRPQGRLSIDSELDIIDVRRCVRGIAQEAGFGATDVTRIVTAASELARHVYGHAGRCTMGWRGVHVEGADYLELSLQSTRDCMAEVEADDGLAGVRRLMGCLETSQQTGQGTVFALRRALPGGTTRP